MDVKCPDCQEILSPADQGTCCPFCGNIKIEDAAKASAIEDFEEHFEKEATLEGNDVYQQALHLACNAYEHEPSRQKFVSAYAKAYEEEAVKHDIFPFE
jgi:hypothetical protein